MYICIVSVALASVASLVISMFGNSGECYISGDVTSLGGSAAYYQRGVLQY